MSEKSVGTLIGHGLDGTWTAIDDQFGGVTIGIFRGLTWTFSGNHYTRKQSGRVVSGGSFQTDPTTNPKIIDLIPEIGNHKEKMIHCIYEVENELLKICLPTDPSNKRPADFTSKTFDQWMFILKRK